MEKVEERTPIMCGGCGETDSSKRCMGCMHDFATPESSWVRKYNPLPTSEEAGA